MKPVILALVAVSPFPASLHCGEDAGRFDQMTCRFAVSPGSDLDGLSAWASSILSRFGDGSSVWKRGERYDLQPLLSQARLSRRVLAYCRNNPSKTIRDAFATILREATTPRAPQNTMLWHQL